MRTRVIVPVALAAVLVLGACGSDDSVSDGSPPAPDDTGEHDDEMRAPRPIEMVAGSVDPGSGANAESASTDRMAADDMAINPWTPTEYVVGEGMPALPTADTGYVYPARSLAGAGELDDQVAALAAALGVSGETRYTEDEYSAWWQVGPDDGSGPALWVYADAQLSWNYQGPWADSVVSSECVAVDPAVVDGGPDGDLTTDDAGTVTEAELERMTACAEPEPPVGVPDAGGAEQRARDLIVALGDDPASFEYDSYADQWFASVQAVEQIDARPAGRRFDLGFGAEGVLQYASGQLALPQPVGPYPLVDLDTALARLNAQQQMYARGGIEPLPVDVAEAGVSSEVGGGTAGSVGSVGTADTAEPPPDDRGGVAEPVPTEPLPEEPVEPMPVEPIPEPEPVTVTLVGVEADLWWAWDVDGSVWLVPAYRFIDTDGGWHVVPAVTDEYLVVTELPAPEPLPVDPPVDPPGDTLVPDSVPPETVPGEPPVDTKPGEQPPPVPGETTPGLPEEFDTALLEPFVGLTVDEFTAEADALGATVRVVRQNGEDLAVTMDYSPTRVNVAAEADIVVAITGVG